MGNGVFGSINTVTTYSPGSYELSWLFSGSKWGGEVGTGVTLKFSFVSNPGAVSYDSSVGSAFTLTQQNAAKLAQATWAAVADIKFVQVADTTTSAGDIRWINSTSAETAYAYYPSAWEGGGDIWVGPYYPEYKSPVPGNYGFMTYVHEMGHALGLQHPHSVANTPALHDQLKYSIMSYRDYAGDTLNGLSSSVLPSTPMLDDIKAIQKLYGKNMGYNTGNNVYKWTATQSIYQTIWDAGGVDTIDASTQSTGVFINLNPGTFSTIGKKFFNGLNYVNDCLAIAYDCTIENATGSSLADTLYGNSSGNILLGGAGNDRIFGFAGNDVLNGGAGIDSMTGGAGNDTYYIDNIKDVISETSTLISEIDTVVSGFTYTLGANLERLTLTGATAINGYGNSLDNVIVGNAANNILSGGAGADTLNGLAGGDTMIGGAGNDTYVVDNIKDVVSEVATNSAEFDTVISSISYTLGANLERLILSGSSAINASGNALDNVLIGNSGSNTLNGGAGADTLSGGTGADTLVGGTGSDVLSGGADNDTLQGGDGADSFIFDSLAGYDRILDFSSGSDRIVLDNSALGGVGNKDGVLDSSVTSAGSGFDSAAELVVFTNAITGTITSESAAALIGSAANAFSVDEKRIFVVNNSTESGLFVFSEKHGDSAVTSDELQLIGMVNAATTTLGDYVFQA